MIIKKISIPLSEQEYRELVSISQRGYRRPQDYARMIVLESIRNAVPTNSKSATGKVCEAETVNAFASVNP